MKHKMLYRSVFTMSLAACTEIPGVDLVSGNAVWVPAAK
jgi:hypothetical protein